VVYDDGTWFEGYMKEGVLHGFIRKFDEKGRLTFVGSMKNGKEHGVCWKIIRGGGVVVGRVDELGELSGIRFVDI
jgi:antitoxin component YwqK of YwqJK toxin-antitoxin module